MAKAEDLDVESPFLIRSVKRGCPSAAPNPNMNYLFLDTYTFTVTRRKVAGMEVRRELLLAFWLLNRVSSSF